MSVRLLEVLYHFNWFGLGCDLWCCGRNFAYGQIAEDLWLWKTFSHVDFPSLLEEPHTWAKMWSDSLTARRSTKFTQPDHLWHRTGDGIQPKPLALWCVTAKSIEMVQYMYNIENLVDIIETTVWHSGGVGTSCDWLYKLQKSDSEKSPKPLNMVSLQKKAFWLFLGFENVNLNISPIFQPINKIKAASHTTGCLECISGFKYEPRLNVLWVLTTLERVRFAYVRGVSSWCPLPYLKLFSATKTVPGITINDEFCGFGKVSHSEWVLQDNVTNEGMITQGGNMWCENGLEAFGQTKTVSDNTIND